MSAVPEGMPAEAKARAARKVRTVLRNAQSVLELIRKLCDEVKAGLLLVSHDPTITAQLPRAVSLADLNRASAA